MLQGFCFFKWEIWDEHFWCCLSNPLFLNTHLKSVKDKQCVTYTSNLDIHCMDKSIGTRILIVNSGVLIRPIAKDV